MEPNFLKSTRGQNYNTYKLYTQSSNYEACIHISVHNFTYIIFYYPLINLYAQFSLISNDTYSGMNCKRQTENTRPPRYSIQFFKIVVRRRPDLNIVFEATAQHCVKIIFSHALQKS